MTAISVLCAAPVSADGHRFAWPLRPRPPVVAGFHAPSPNWQPGHRGVDLGGAPGQPVHAAGPGTVVFAGELAGRSLVSIAHPGGLRTSYEPVGPAVRRGQAVRRGTVVGHLMAGHPGCAAPACLHWGAMWGPAARADYVDPLGLLASTPIRLKPVRRYRRVPVRPAGGPGHARPAAWQPRHGCRAEWSPSLNDRAVLGQPAGLRHLRGDGWRRCAEGRGGRCRAPP